MRLHVTVQHRLVDARVVALVAFERLGAEMVAQVVLQVVLVLGDERTLGALQALVVFDVTARVLPVLLLYNNRVSTKSGGLVRIATSTAECADAK